MISRLYQFEISTLLLAGSLTLSGCGEPMATLPLEKISDRSQTAAEVDNTENPSPPPLPPPPSSPPTSPSGGSGGSKGNSIGTCRNNGRRYALHIPAGLSPTTAAPVVVAMHGLGDDFQNFNSVAQSLGWHSVADQKGFIFVTPEPVNPTRQSFLSFKSDGSADLTAIQSQMNSLYECLVQDLGSRYNIELLNINWIGFSEGASFVGVAASYLSKRLHSVALYAGSAPRIASAVERLIPIAYVTGTADFSYSTIVSQSDSWRSHPLRRDWIPGIPHSFSALNSAVPPVEMYTWLQSHRLGL